MCEKSFIFLMTIKSSFKSFIYYIVNKLIWKLTFFFFKATNRHIFYFILDYFIVHFLYACLNASYSKEISVSRPKKNGRCAKSIFPAYALRDLPDFMPPRPHQMPRGNATSHEYRTDTFGAKTGVSNHVTEMRTSVTAGVETAIMNPCQ